MKDEVLKLKLDAVNKLIPYIKLVLTQRLHVPVRTEEVYHEFFRSAEFDRLFEELIVDKLDISLMTSLLREKSLSTGEIADFLGLSPSQVAKYINGSSKQGLLRYDVNSKSYALA
jgi:F420-non-reducing hydrogenase iron-sulfur subunit